MTASPSPEVVVGVTGSIAAYKAADLVRRLRECGCAVTCVLTREAERFLAPLTLQALSGRRVQTDLFGLDDPHVLHTELADHAKLILIAPATANIIGKLAHGLADDVLTCLTLATKAPVLLAPAMNVHMWQHATVRTNMARLKALGYHVVGPTHGPLVCGYEAIGHLAEVDDVVQASLKLLKRFSGLSMPAAAPPRPTARRASRSASRARKR